MLSSDATVRQRTLSSASLGHQARIYIVPEFRIESGRVLKEVPVAYHCWGRLNESRTNVMLICHALTGSSDVSDWWSPIFGTGHALDPQKFFIVCCNVTGSPYGTLSPLSVNPETQQPYGASYPADITLRDCVRLHRACLDSLGIERVQVALGGSMGGMTVLEWASTYPDYIGAIVPIATSAKQSGWCIGWSEAQRNCIYADPMYQDGQYAPDEAPVAGLAAARMQALMTYRSKASFDRRFGRHQQSTPSGLFMAQSYLRYQGQKFVQRFDANCYIALTRLLDTHDISRLRGKSISDVLRCFMGPALVVGVQSDVLYPVEDQIEIHEGLPRSRLVILDSDEGHDGFLIELETLDAIIKSWLYDNVYTDQQKIHSPSESPQKKFIASNLCGEIDDFDASCIKLPD